MDYRKLQICFHRPPSARDDNDRLTAKLFRIASDLVRDRTLPSPEAPDVRYLSSDRQALVLTKLRLLRNLIRQRSEARGKPWKFSFDLLPSGAADGAFVEGLPDLSEDYRAIKAAMLEEWRVAERLLRSQSGGEDEDATASKDPPHRIFSPTVKDAIFERLNQVRQGQPRSGGEMELPDPFCSPPVKDLIIKAVAELTAELDKLFATVAAWADASQEAQ